VIDAAAVRALLASSLSRRDAILLLAATGGLAACGRAP
jgi:hypothetical protein